MEIEKSIVKIKEEVSRIFKKCGIDSSKKYSDEERFNNAYKLFEYVVKNSKYDKRIMGEKNQADPFELVVRDVYRCLCEHRSVCTSDAAALSLLFEQAGIDNRHLTIAEKGIEPQGVHQVVSFRIAGKVYICDPTLTRTTMEAGIIPDVNPSIFAFTPEKFFDMLYPTKEVKAVNSALNLNKQPLSRQK